MLADNRTTLAENVSIQGDLERSIKLSNEALDISLRASNYWGQAYALVTMAPIYLELGCIDQAFDAWERGLEAAERANFTAPASYSLSHMALAYAELGDLDKGFDLIQLSRSKTRDLALPAFINLPASGLEHLHILAGDLDKAKRTTGEPIGPVELARSEPVMFSLVVTTRMVLNLAKEEYEEALAAADEALELAHDGKLSLTIPELLLLKGKALRGLGRLGEAAGVLEEAAGLARAYNSRRMLVPILAQLMDVERQRGNDAAAEAAQEEGRTAVAFTTEHISDPELRAKYAQTEPVQALNS
jgi:tetratricopeptide (TPR) repeat protein